MPEVVDASQPEVRHVERPVVDGSIKALSCGVWAWDRGWDEGLVHGALRVLFPDTG